MTSVMPPFWQTPRQPYLALEKSVSSASILMDRKRLSERIVFRRIGLFFLSPLALVSYPQGEHGQRR